MTKCTVLPAKSDSDVIFCLQLLSNLYTPLELTRIDRSLLYKSYPAGPLTVEIARDMSVVSRNPTSGSRNLIHDVISL